MKGSSPTKLLIRILLISIFSFGISACGGGSSNDEEATILTGVFVDSIVIGLDYKTETQSSKTNELGEFEYLEGETVTFSIGDIELGSARGSEKITTFDIGDDLENEDVPRAVLLQSLDENQNPADGSIDLRYIDPDKTAGLTLDSIGEVTQTTIDTITDGVDGTFDIVTPEEAISHATISSSGDILEEDGVLKFNTILTQADINAGNYRVQNRVGIELEPIEPITTNPSFSIESDLTAISVQDQVNGRLRNSLAIFDGVNEYYLGLGIRYRNGEYSVNYYVEGFDQSGFYEYPSTKLAAFDQVTIEENKTYNFKLEYMIETDQVNAYIDGVKVITWDDADLGDRDGVGASLIRAYAETRSQADVDPLTGGGQTAGTAMIGTVDNLIVQLDGQNILSDNFDDDKLDNDDINYLERKLREGSPSLTNELLVQNPWYAIFIDEGECFADKFALNLDGTGTVTIGENGLEVVPLSYFISNDNKLTIDYGDNTDTEEWFLNSINTDRIDFTFNNVPAVFFKDRNSAIEYVDDVTQNSSCGEELPQ